MRYDVGRFRRPMRRGAMEQMVSLISLGDGSTLTLDFTTGVLDSRLTFTRASTTATYINSSGYVTTAGTNVPRFDHDPTTLAPKGLLIEGQSENLCRNSNDIYVTAWWGSSAGITATQDTSIPDPSNGTQSCKIVKSAGTQFVVRNQILPTVTVPANSTVNVTASVWLRMNGAGQAATSIGIFDLGGTGFGTRNGAFVSNSAVTISSGSGSDVDFTFGAVTGWVRVGVTRSITNSTASPVSYTQLSFFIYPDRYSTNTATIFAWGAQFEIGAGASSLIPTGASTATRVADSCVMTGTNFSSWFAGATEGVLYTQFEKPRSQSGTIGHDHAAVGSQYGSGTAFIVYAAASVYYPTTLLWPTGGVLFPGGIASAIPNVSKQAGKWFGGNDATNYANGVQGTTSAGTGTLAPNMLTIGANSASGTAATRDWLNACVRTVKFWPVALPDSQIIALTTP